MKIDSKELKNLLYVRDKCEYSVYKKCGVYCLDCPYYEGYCHFKYYLETKI